MTEQINVKASNLLKKIKERKIELLESYVNGEIEYEALCSEFGRLSEIEDLVNKEFSPENDVEIKLRDFIGKLNKIKEDLLRVYRDAYYCLDCGQVYLPREVSTHECVKNNHCLIKFDDYPEGDESKTAHKVISWVLGKLERTLDESKSQ